MSRMTFFPPYILDMETLKVWYVIESPEELIKNTETQAFLGGGGKRRWLSKGQLEEEKNLSHTLSHIKLNSSIQGYSPLTSGAFQKGLYVSGVNVSTWLLLCSVCL